MCAVSCRDDKVAAHPLRVRIYYVATGRGLVKDAQLLAAILGAQGMAVEIHEVNHVSVNPKGLYEKASRWLYRRGWLRFEAWLTRREQWLIKAAVEAEVDLNIHLERIFRDRLRSASTNIFVPNQEWFPPEQRRLLNLIDAVACKSQHGLERFRQLLPCHPAIIYTGFSTLAPPAASQGLPLQCLHIAGHSPLKGTQTVVAVWQRHPEWPMLHLVTDLVVAADAANIRCHRDLDAAAIAELRTHCLIAVQPSEVEGFGHVLAEPMTAAGVVVTTDGPPMNELVQPGRGFLVRYGPQRPLRAGTCYQVDEAALEAELERVFATPLDALRLVGEEARRWQLAAHQQFASRLVELVNTVVAVRHNTGGGSAGQQGSDPHALP